MNIENFVYINRYFDFHYSSIKFFANNRKRFWMIVLILLTKLDNYTHASLKQIALSNIYFFLSLFFTSLCSNALYMSFTVDIWPLTASIYLHLFSLTHDLFCTSVRVFLHLFIDKRIPFIWKLSSINLQFGLYQFDEWMFLQLLHIISFIDWCIKNCVLI